MATILRLLLSSMLAIGLLAPAAPAAAADLSQTAVLVAKRQLADPFYRSTVIVV